MGTCLVGEQVECALGNLEPGARETITIELVAGQVEAIEVSGVVKDGLECETEPSNNEVTGTILVKGEIGPAADGGVEGEPLGIDGFDPGGGCTCHMPRQAQRGGAGCSLGLDWHGLG